MAEVAGRENLSPQSPDLPMTLTTAGLDQEQPNEGQLGEVRSVEMAELGFEPAQLPAAPVQALHSDRRVSFAQSQGDSLEGLETVHPTSLEAPVTRNATNMTRMSSFGVSSRGISASISGRLTALIDRGRSSWRFPETPGTMPRYVQKNFRVKTFSLMGMQMMLVFAIMVLVDVYSLSESLFAHSGNQSRVILYVFGLLNLTCLMCLYCAKERYPHNYIFLALSTLLSGVFWGLTKKVMDTLLGFQIIATLCISMFVAAPMSAFLTDRKLSGTSVLLSCMIGGWTVGCFADIIVASVILKEDPIVILGSVGFSFLLLSILTLDAGKLLIRCHPDDFMSVIVSMNSTLMVVVSIPFFVLSFCFLHTGDAVLDDGRDEEAPSTQQAPEAATLGREERTEEA
eukprot:TRINITY_DN53493_c0_g1_i1.p1 TRINITY_DN53493_c0_g1~~TRINITY_DN53493_c0_g1_i1.p1  ORF type:complete len:399 (-),score=32.46 TRINITY_DN53493_c0_g1_i1:230-1426(-)